MSKLVGFLSEKINKVNLSLLEIILIKLKAIIFLSIIIIPFKSFSDVDGILELSDGACWAQMSKEGVKISSFKEQWAYSETIDNLENKLTQLILNQQYFERTLGVKNLNLGIHCGAYGLSIIAKVETNLGDFCLWTKVAGKELEIRSFGSMGEDLKNHSDFCDGRKWGELLINIINPTVLAELKNEKWDKYFEMIKPVSGNLYKIVLRSEYYLHEEDVKKIILETLPKTSIDYIEYNDYQHPIGEYLNLK
jgi:hypothetical protein